MYIYGFIGPDNVLHFKKSAGRTVFVSKDIIEGNGLFATYEVKENKAYLINRNGVIETPPSVYQLTLFEQQEIALCDGREVLV